MSESDELDSQELLNPKRLLKVINDELQSPHDTGLFEHKKISLLNLSILSILQKDKKFKILEVLLSQLSIREYSLGIEI